MTRRERRRKAARQGMVDAAIRLLETGGSRALTMRNLAAEAGVSEMTPYNHFTNKAGVVAAVFDRAMGQIADPASDIASGDPIGQMLESTERVAETWTRQGGWFRELLRSASESGAEFTQFAERPKEMLRLGLTAAISARQIGDEVPVDLLAEHIANVNSGVFDRWVRGDIAGSAVAAELRTGMSVALLGVAEPGSRSRILSELARPS